MLIVLITILGPVSGAHFNPAVTLVFERSGNRRCVHGAYVVAHSPAGSPGQFGARDVRRADRPAVGGRCATAARQGFSEGVATFGLVRTILAGCASTAGASRAVGLYIIAAYWFTASTSFANPAVTVARSLTQQLRRHPPGRPARLHRRTARRRRDRGDVLMAGCRGRAGFSLTKGRPDMTVTIYHNPACGTSRNTLAMIRKPAEEPE